MKPWTELTVIRAALLLSCTVILVITGICMYAKVSSSINTFSYICIDTETYISNTLTAFKMLGHLEMNKSF